MEIAQAKIVLIGDINCGKSSIIYRYTTGKFNETISTVSNGMHSKLASVKSSQIKLNIWDTAGEERFHSISKLFFRDTNAIMIVFDLTQQFSIKGLVKWYEIVKSEGIAQTSKILIIGNKSDLEETENNEEEAKEFAQNIGAKFFKVSAKSGQMIEETFLHIAAAFVAEGKRNGVRQSINLNNHSNTQEKKKKSCCKA